jgi:hypothetical protein
MAARRCSVWPWSVSARAAKQFVKLARETPLKDAINLADIRQQLTGGYVDLTGGLIGSVDEECTQS